jgi:hypothetical protein
MLSPSSTCRPRRPHTVPRHVRPLRPSLIPLRCPTPRNSPNPCLCMAWSIH